MYVGRAAIAAILRVELLEIFSINESNYYSISNVCMPVFAYQLHGITSRG